MIAEQEIRAAAAATPQTSLPQLVWRAWPITRQPVRPTLSTRAPSTLCVCACARLFRFVFSPCASEPKKVRKTKQNVVNRTTTPSFTPCTVSPTHRRLYYYYYYCTPNRLLQHTDPLFRTSTGWHLFATTQSVCKVHPIRHRRGGTLRWGLCSTYYDYHLYSPFDGSYCHRLVLRVKHKQWTNKTQTKRKN